MQIYFTRRFYASPDQGRTTKVYLPGRTYVVPVDIPEDIAAAALELRAAMRGSHRIEPPAEAADVKAPPDNKAHRAPANNKSSRRNLAE